MDNLLQGLKNVVVYIDDILVTGETEEENLNTLDEVLTRFERVEIRLTHTICLQVQSHTTGNYRNITSRTTGE